MPSNYAKSSKTILFVVFPQVKLLDIAGPLQVFTDACHRGGAQYNVSVASLGGGMLETDTVLSINTSQLEKWRNIKIDTMIIGGGSGADAAAKNAQLVALVTELAMNAKRVGSVCTGAFVLAATGLLDNRRAVTHWESCAKLQDEYPKVSVEADPIFITDRGVWSSAGVTAGIDMALAMVAEDFGKQSALSTARYLVTYVVRPGGQSQFSTALENQTKDSLGRFEKLHHWIADNLAADLSVDALAAFVGMSPRNFTRRYIAEIGLSPAKSIESIRVEAARVILESSQMPIKSVAQKSGFGDEERLRRAMQRHLHTAPSEYRERFQR